MLSGRVTPLGASWGVARGEADHPPTPAGTTLMSGVASLRKGEWHQDLYGWGRVLGLASGGKFARVELEADDAGNVDDVVAWPHDPSAPVEYTQVKFHVASEAERYSVDSLMALSASARRTIAAGGKARSTSLLQKFFASWKQLGANGRPVRLVLYSNWGWLDGDPLQPLISGTDDHMRAAFFAEHADTPVGKAREQWRAHVQASPEDFEAFMRIMEFRVGRGSSAELEEHVADRMGDRGFHADQRALTLAVSQIGAWIRKQITVITPAMYEAAIADLGLRLPSADPAVRVHLHTIERQQFFEAADHTVDWREHFVPTSAEEGAPRGHQLHNAAAWQQVLLPELRALKQRINMSHIRLLRVRGQARLSAWTAFGHVFDGRSRYILELEQNGKVWRTDATPQPGGALLTVTTQSVGASMDVGVAVAITNPVLPAAQRAIETLGLPVSTLIHLAPVGGPSRHAVETAHTMTAMVEEVRREVSDAVAHNAAGCVHLFYAGPLALAAALGHAIGAAAPQLQLYEHDASVGYIPSFLLRA